MALTDAQLVLLTPDQQAAASGLSAAREAYLVSLLDRLLVLKAARYNPSREIRFENGTLVRYNSDAELSSAIASLEAEIAEFLGVDSPRFLRLSLRSGLTG